MSFLFEIQGKVALPKVEILLVEPFKTIWDRDKSKDKNMAIRELSYVEFLTSMLKSNPYREYAEDKKESVLRTEIIKDSKWEPDEIVNLCVQKMKEFQEEGSLTYKYWLSNKLVLEKQIEFFNQIDINERNPKTLSPIYKPKDIPDAVANAEKVLTTINALKSKVDEELFESSKLRGQKTVSPFANPESLKRK